jgi:hypothetical protein
VTTCGDAAGGTFDLSWTRNGRSDKSSIGVTQYRLSTFRFDNLSAIKAESADVTGTALGHQMTDAPGLVGTTRGKNVATE